MNFLAHAAVARWYRVDAPFVLGAMLPDFCSMAGARLARIDHPTLADGVALHHATDRVFHMSPTFAALSGSVTEALRARGVRRGTAEAVGHVGVELLLDGTLAGDDALGAAYLEAIDLARHASMQTAIAWRTAEGGQRFSLLGARLASWGVPRGYGDPAIVAERLVRILAQRPMLALAPGALPATTDVLRSAKADVAQSAPALFDEVRRGLRS